MFDIGFQELLIIGVVALLVVGPERLPRLARTTGLWVGKVRRMVAQVKDDVERELHAEDLKRMVEDPGQLNDIYGAVDGIKEDIDSAMSDFSEDLTEPAAEPPAGTARSKSGSGDGEPAATGSTDAGPAGPATGDAGPAEPETTKDGERRA